MRRRSVSITGATGFVGWHLVEGFRDAGWDVRAIVRPGSAKALPEGVTRVEAALDVEELARALEGSEVLVHAAAVTRGRGDAPFESTNVEGTRRAVAAANRLGLRLVHISSLAAAGTGTVQRPVREEDPPHPLTPYGRSKLAAEAIVRTTATVPWTIVRPSAVYGPRDRGFLPLFRMASRGRFVLPGRPETPFTLIYIDDLTRALIAAADEPRAAGQTLFLGHPVASTAAEILKGLAAAYERPYRPLRLPGPLVVLAAVAGELQWLVGGEPMIDRSRLAELRAAGFVCAVDRARERLGFTASVALDEGLVRTARWYAANGWL